MDHLAFNFGKKEKKIKFVYGDTLTCCARDTWNHFVFISLPCAFCKEGNFFTFLLEQGPY